MSTTEVLQVLRKKARSIYKELIRYSSVHPNLSKKKKYIEQIRKDFRRFHNFQDSEKIAELLKKAEDRLSFIKMEVPSSCISIRHRMKELNPNRNQITTFAVDSDGKIAASISSVINTARYMNWCDGNLDPDDKRKNDSLIERFHYRGPYWEKRRKGWLPQEVIDMWDGPSFTEAMIEREKYDIGFDLPTPTLDEHPDVKGRIPEIARRADFGFDNEPDVVAFKVKRKREVDAKDINDGIHAQYQQQIEDRKSSKPTPIEFLRGRRTV